MSYVFITCFSETILDKYYSCLQFMISRFEYRALVIYLQSLLYLLNIYATTCIVFLASIANLLGRFSDKSVSPITSTLQYRMYQKFENSKFLKFFSL